MKDLILKDTKELISNLEYFYKFIENRTDDEVDLNTTINRLHTDIQILKNKTKI